MRPSAKKPLPQVNLTPVLGLVTILIPLLLMAYAPEVLAVIDSDVPSLCTAGCDEADHSEPVTPRVRVTAAGLELAEVVVEPGAPVGETTLPCGGPCRSADDYDWTGLQDTLARTLTETDSTGSVAIVPTDDVPYDVVVETMDACRERLHPDGTREPLYPRPMLGSAG